jgi:hypothetical protein
VYSSGLRHARSAQKGPDYTGAIFARDARIAIHRCRLPPISAAHFTNATPVSIVPYIVTLPPWAPKPDGPPSAQAPQSKTANIAATHVFITTSLASLHDFSF